MPHEEIKVTGEITDIFAHRFVVKTTRGNILADLTPKGAERITLKEGDRVELIGERKPSELKVHSIARNGGRAVQIDHDHPHEHADPEPALKTAAANGFNVVGEPRRKPKHFEILGRDASGDLVELHIELDGRLRKSRPVPEGDSNWAQEIEGYRQLNELGVRKPLNAGCVDFP
jgi:hypothetical protein